MTDATQEPASGEQLAATAAIPSTPAAPLTETAAVLPVPTPEPTAPAVTHESFLSEFAAVVKRDARGISHHLEALIAKAEKHFGL